MKNLREMKIDELKDIARGYTITGAWRMTKDKLIEAILANAKVNGQSGLYFDGNSDPETEETKIPGEDYEATYAGDTLIAVSRTEDITETTEEARTEEEAIEDSNKMEADAKAEENESKETKRPSLKINEITFNGKTQSLRDWAKELEMPWPTLYDRINRNGWTVEEALTIPLGSRRKKKA